MSSIITREKCCSLSAYFIQYKLLEEAVNISLLNIEELNKCHTGGRGDFWMHTNLYMPGFSLVTFALMFRCLWVFSFSV